ncbi:MAG: hypothetical protein KC457_21815, partial [Myxococcales bacterium]|nr:hypothetical protein [Myxococcales bacterium]
MNRRAWLTWLGSALVLCLLADLVLAQVLPPAAVPSHARADPDVLRATLRAAVAAADDGQRTILLIGDSTVSGEALATVEPHRWRELRVIEQLRDELAIDARERVHFEEIALAGLLPGDMAQIGAALDRLDPEGRVELLLEVDLGDFSEAHAADGCSRPELCSLDEVARLQPVLAWLGMHTPILRHGDRLLGIEEDDEASSALGAPPQLAEVRIDPDHAQVQELQSLLEEAADSGRPVTGFMTPLADGTLGSPELLGDRAAALATIFMDRGATLIDLDHPLFVDGLFIDGRHLDGEGSEILAINLLYELGLPLRTRPFDWQMVHPEGSDRTLVHGITGGAGLGGALTARFAGPEGLATDEDGSELFIADTQNHVLRRLRGNMQFVESAAGVAGQAGHRDGPVAGEDGALLDHPRLPVLLAGELWFIDGAKRQHLRRLGAGQVETPALQGRGCAGHRLLRQGNGGLWILCEDDRLLWLDPGEGRLHELTLGGVEDVRSFDVGPDRLFAADGQGVIWERQLSQAEPGQVPRLGGWKRLFRNKSRNLLPDGFQVGFPYGYDEVGLAEVVDLRWVEHYRGLLVADRFPLGVDDPRLERELSERIHLRFFELDEARVLPWIKPMVHGDVYQLWNEQAQIIAGYHHEGSLALVQHDASLFWLERGRSRLLRIGDGMLGTAKTGNHHARNTTVPLFQTIWKVSGRVERQLRPDRHLDARHEYLPRRGPFVAVMFNSSL